MYDTGDQATGGSRAAKPHSEWLKKLLDYAVENPLKLLSTFVLTSGGMMLLSFFAHIGFLPDVDLNAATSMLYAVSLLGLLIAVFATLIMVMPGWLVGMGRDAVEGVTHRDVSVALVLGLITTLAFLLATAGFSSSTAVSRAEWPMNIAMFVCVITAFMSWLKRWRCTWIVAAWSGSFIIGLIPLLLLLRVAAYGDLAVKPTTIQRVVLFCLVSLLFIATWAVAVTKAEMRWKVAIALGPLTLFAVFCLTGSFSAIAQMTVQRFSLGEMYYTRVVVDSKACQQVNEALGQKVCDGGKDDEAVTICPVVLRSRIGSQVVLEFAPMAVVEDSKGYRAQWQDALTKAEEAAAGEVRYRRVVLAKEQLKTWTVLRAELATSAARAPASAPAGVASWLTPKQGGIDQPEPLTHVLAAMCPGGGRADLPASGASQPAIASPGHTVIQIDAKGSATHQTFLQVQVQNAVSQNTATLAGAAAGAGALAGAAAGSVNVVRVPTRRTPPHKSSSSCPPPVHSESCCETRCCTVSQTASEATPRSVCPAASSVELVR